jgi:hypothetical protein
LLHAAKHLRDTQTSFDNWAVVWSDSAEIKKITDASAGQLTKWKERISAGEASLKLPLIEYTTGHVESKLPLDFERETTLINSLEPLNGAQFLDKMHDRKPFHPFVAMLEGSFLLPYNASKMFRCRWEYLNNPVLPLAGMNRRLRRSGSSGSKGLYPCRTQAREEVGN